MLDKNKSEDNSSSNRKKILAEQHKNTRHDAVEKMQEIRAKWAEKYNFDSCEAMLNEITGAIFNLKQREPNL